MALILKSFEDLFKTSLYKDLDKLCDAIIIADDGTKFKAHKLFLSMRSEYFKAYFRSNIENKDSLVLSINKDILENILIFIYTGEVNFDTQTIGFMIIAADYLLIEDLLVQCKRFAFQEISIENCISLLNASYTVKRLGITNHCYRFVQVHFGSLIDYEDSGIEDLPYSALKSLLNDDSLCVTDEESVWKAIVIWVNGNDAENLKYVPELLTCIRWTSVKDFYRLVSCISKQAIFRENAFCKSINLDNYAPAFKHEMLQSVIQNPHPERCPSKMHVFMRRNTSRSLNNASELYVTYDEQLDMWRKIGETDKNFSVMFAIDRFIFMFNAISREMKAFDLFEKTWVEKQNIRSSRQAYCVVESQKCIFVIGGYSHIMDPHTAVECYNAEEDSWRFCSPIPSINVCGVAAINRKLYIVGYEENSDRLEMRALVYNILNEEWSDIEIPRHFRTNFGIINFQEKIYLFGGRTEENSVTTSVETYCTVKNEWKELPDLPFPYELPNVIILKDNLLVYDDCPASGMMSRFSPCAWNNETHAWNVENTFSPFNEIYMYVICCIEDRDILLKLSKENKNSETVWEKTPFANN